MEISFYALILFLCICFSLNKNFSILNFEFYYKNGPNEVKMSKKRK